MKNGGGHFAPELGGHFELESGGHFKLELGGQYHWNLHFKQNRNKLIKTSSFRPYIFIPKNHGRICALGVGSTPLAKRLGVQ